ncbi:hypothetical protein K456DRAFT_55716 [Colletotrichum gloeosporioides 23]|nr:hypothetical protein K456DRAFT_55716 [Colletotrichum gloeosporioides 23]KAJ0287603.1 hypothetical protein COL940_002444 [Colletotrichum noveboracense]KAJ0293951.1 hypothetical protein CBS470a_001331 [Colletotrichum nupharicola]KAJ0321801.1 hypothetical protein Brms1b_002500 [Colletotrichum noveboracense]
MAICVFDKFFDLPQEIRDQIISYLCLLPNPIQVGPTVDTEIPFPHDLLLSHPLLYAAGSAIFYEQNRFILNLRGRPRAALERAICDGTPWLLGNTRARRRVKYLELSPGRLGNVFQSHISPAVADMILNGSLRHLKLVLYPTSTDKVVFNHDAVDAQGRRAAMTRRDDAFTQSKPFKALLRLLADPDLETAELFVDPIHRDFWCDFHEGVACCKGHPKGPWQLISVDWKKLAASYGQDHELSIVRVTS